MFVWCSLLFLLGIAAFLDSMFTFGDIFRRINSVLFMLISLGLLIRTTTKMKMGRVEKLIEKTKKLEQEMKTLRSRKVQDQNKSKKSHELSSLRS